MRDTDLIHGLTFDLAFAATSDDSMALADWVQADLLPVVEEVLDQFRGMGRRRIERLEIDLGTVAAAQARSELARRLFAQLSTALEQALDEGEAAGMGGQGQGADMLAFLGTGSLPWAAAYGAGAAHTTLLRQVIDSPQAHQVLSAALREAHMLTRLVRQFDAQALLAAAEALFTAWTPADRGAALAWAGEELRRLRDAGGETESFWRWFLPQYAQPARPGTLQARWRQAGGDKPAAAPDTAIADVDTIEQALERADAALLAPYWDRILASTPQRLRSAHPRLWQRWLEQFDAAMLADILGVVQADCAWLIESLAVLVPRPQLNALLRPAMPQWLAAPVDSLAPQLVLEWIKAALPEQAGRIGTLFAASGGGQADAQLLSTVRDLCLRWPPAQRDAMLAWAGEELRRLRDGRLDPAPFWRWLLRQCARATGVDALMQEWTTMRQGAAATRARASVVGTDSAGFTPDQLRTIGQGLETADFALLAPYWARIVSSAPQCLREAHPRCWERWLRNFDDATLTDIAGVVQADCAWLFDSVATVVPQARQHAQLRPVLQQWLAAPLDSLAPQRVLDWLKAAAPDQSSPITALFAAQAPHAATAGAGFTAAEMRAIEQGLDTADFTLLAPYWARIVSDAPQCVRAAHPRCWERWLRNFDDATLTGIVGVVQGGCSGLIDNVAAAAPALLRPALRQWLAAPVDSLAPQQVRDWLKTALPEQFAPVAAGFTAAEMRVIERGLETADFALLAPYWARIVSGAPQCLRAAHPRCWERWLRNFDDATLIEILGVVQAGCAGSIDSVAAAVPRAPQHAPLRPVLQQWLAAPVDTLAPQRVHDWVEMAVPEQSVPVAGQYPAQAPYGAMEGAGFTPAEMRSIEQGLETGDFSLLAPHWERVLSSARQWLRSVHPRLWKQWLRNFDDGTLADIFQVVQADCAWLIDALAALVPRSGLGAQLRPAMQQWLAAPPDSLAPQVVLDWVAASMPEQSGHLLAMVEVEQAAQARQGHELWLAAARVLFAPWPQAQRDAVMAWAEEQLRRLDDAGADCGAFRRWFLPHCAAPVGLPALVQKWSASGGTVLAYQQLCAALRDPQACSNLVRQLDGQQRLSAARVLFDHWPQAERDGVLAWAAVEAQRRLDAGTDAASFWEWLLPLHADPTALFAPEAATVIQQGLATAGPSLVVPDWPRLLAVAPQSVRAAHPQRWRQWLASFDDDVLMDILSVVQPDCKPMLEGMTALMSRERLLPLLRPALPAWLGAAPDRLSPRVMLMHVMKAAPQHADALAALGYAQAPVAADAAAGQPAAVDSKHFREPLRVLGSLFARAEIITISKALNAGQFAPLAPYWDRLLVLAPHWLRSEYPRLARTWVAGFDDEVLIDILAVVQAECCALIEQLASALPREQLHAALRPSLARWFDAGLDRLAPQAIMDEVLRATGGQPAAFQAWLGATAAEADPEPLEQLLLHGDAAQLQRIWPSIVMSQRAHLRRIWKQWPAASRVQAIARFTAELSLAQQVDAALILQPAAAMLMAELQQQLAEHPEHSAILGTALQLLLHAEVASAVPEHLMRCVQERHGAWCAGLLPAQTRHIAAALAVIAPAPAARAPEVRGAAWAAAQLSPEALRDYVAACRRDDAQLGQLDSARMHGLVRAWAGFQQAGGGAGTFLAALEAGALATAAPHKYFGKVLQQAMLGEAIDLEAIGEECGTLAPAAVPVPLHIEDLAARQVDMVRSDPQAHGGPSPLSDLLCQALPQRLAEALLRADLSALDALWPDIVRHHPALLGQAAQRYLGRAEARNRLIGSTDAGKMLDLLGCLSAHAAQLLAPLLDSAARFSATLPVPLAPNLFQQRVLRFAFAQVMDHPTAAMPAEWVSGLLGAVLPASAQQAGSTLVAHAWYELLRGGGTLLEAAFEHTLLGNTCLEVAQRRLRTAPGAGLGTALPDVLQHMLTLELCNGHAALTDQLLADGALADADPTVFSAAEWQALARAQLPRLQREVQLAFWRAFSARLPAPAANRGADEDEVQAALAAAFAILKPPAWQAGEAASPPRAPADPALSAASADTIAILLMREAALDDAATAGIQLLTQRLLANADACTGTTAHAALQSALSQPRAIDRLLASLPGPTLARLLCVLQPALAGVLPAALRAISETVAIPLSAVPATLDGAVWRAIYDAVFAGPMPDGAAALAGALLERLAGEQAQDGPAVLKPDDTPARAATPDEAMAQLLQPLAQPKPEQAVARLARSDDEPLPFTGDANLRNAGLVIVAPYIERLFDLFGITQQGQFVNDAARERGVHVLQYVVTAEESTPEHLLSLNKLLCGIPAAVPVVLGISMSDKEKDTVDQMLKGVIANWSAIGASSVTGLRETFLQREGCLYYQDDAWHLKVPQRTFDMLLDRLPWGYKLIKFSWMAAPLNVAWR